MGRCGQSAGYKQARLRPVNQQTSGALAANTNRLGFFGETLVN